MLHRRLKNQSSTLSISSRFLHAIRWPLLCRVRVYLVPEMTSHSLPFADLVCYSSYVADGMPTPAVSITSAVAGLGLSVPSLTNNINSISIGILVALFMAQRFGTARLSFVFSPGKSPEPIEELLNNTPRVFSGLFVVHTHRWLWHLQHIHLSGHFPCI